MPVDTAIVYWSQKALQILLMTASSAFMDVAMAKVLLPIPSHAQLSTGSGIFWFGTFPMSSPTNVK